MAKKKRLQKGQKLLEQFERLANKLGLKLGKKQLERLKQLRDSGAITANDLPAKLRENFPGELEDVNLNEIRERLKGT